MKKYYLLMLWPVGWSGSANKVMHESVKANSKEAIKEFQLLFPHLLLNDDGYAKIESISYCIAEAY